MGGHDAAARIGGACTGLGVLARGTGLLVSRVYAVSLLSWCTGWRVACFYGSGFGCGLWLPHPVPPLLPAYL